MHRAGPNLFQVPTPRFLILLLLFSGWLSAFAQRGQIIKPASTTVMDPNQDGYVSLDATGFTGTGFTGYYSDEFELSMFGIPIVGSGEALGDNQAGVSCGIADIIVDSLGYGAYAVLDGANNLTFRFRLGDHNPSVESYSILIDVDGKLGADDPNSTPENPGFEIDITLIKNQNMGINLYNIDGIQSCPTPLKNYSYHTNFQIAIADIITCSDLDYFYDFFIPFADLQTYFGFSTSTEMRMVALTNVSGTCAMAGRISDVGGVNDNDYPGCPTCAFLELGTNQCPTSFDNLCQSCGGFQSGVTPKPTINQPVKAGENVLSGTAVPGAELFVDLYNSANVLKESITLLTATGCLACPWSITFTDPMEPGDIVSARAKSSSGCSSGGVSSDATITIVITNTPPQLSIAGTAVTYTENGVPLAIDANILITDPDNFALENATVSISTNFVPGEDLLTFVPIAGVAGAFDAATGVIAFTGAASLTSYQALLRSISYSNISDNPSTVIRSISFQVFDGLDNSNIVSRQVNVSSVNDPPVAVNDSGATTEESFAVVPNISANDTDVDGTVVVSSIDLDPATAGQQISSTVPQGTWSVDATGQVTFTPVTNFNGTATRTYVISDNAGAVSNVATLTVIVSAVNDPPVASNDIGSTNEDVAIILSNIASNDTDLDGTINLSSIDLDPVTAGVQLTVTNVQGTWTIDAGGNLTYSPALNFNGEAIISYVVADNTTALSNVATVSIQVVPVNDAPVAVDDTGMTNENTPAIVPNITANDTDVDGTVIVATIDLDPAVAGQQTSSIQTQGTWSVDGNGDVTFAPVANFNGIAIRSYTVNDDAGTISNSATITVTVNSVNNLPVANDDAGVTNEDVPVTLNGITANDTDVDGTVDPSTIDLDPVTPGQQTTFANADGTWTASGGNVTFTPTIGFVGDASASYTVNDNAGGTSNVATLLVRVNDVIAGNTPPVAVSDNATTDEEIQVILGNITANDTDADGTVLPGTVDLDPIAPGRQTNIITTQGTWSVNDDADVTFAPALNFNGVASHIYTAQDDDGATTNSGTLTVTVNAINDAPVAANDGGATNEDTALLLPLITSNDTDVDGTIDAGSVDLDPLTVGKQTTLNSPEGSWTVDGAGNVTFTPAVNFNGTALASYTVNDNLGLASNAAVLTVGVNTINDAPIANNDSGFTLEDTQVILPDITVNDTDVDGTIAVASVDLDPVTAGTQTSTTNSGGEWSIDVSGNLTFNPAVDFNGTTAIQYVVNDNLGTASNAATVTISVDPVNDPPVALDDTGTTFEDVAIVLPGVTSNDTDVDGTIDNGTVDLDPITAGVQVTLATAQGAWTVSSMADLTFSPAINFNGIASLVYTVEDDQASLSNEGVVTITVEAVNDLPILENLSFETIRNEALSDNLIAGSDTDPDGTVLTINTIPANAPDHGDITINSDGTFTYTPATNYVGSDLVEVELCDQGLPLPAACAIKELHIEILPSNTTPIIVVNSVPGATLNATTLEDTPVIVCFEAIDPDGDPVNISSLVNVEGGGTLVQYGSLFYCFLFTPDPDFSGVSQWALQACDNGTPSLCGNLTITITVTTVNDLPVAVDDNGTTDENTPVTLPNITANDTDIDGTVLASTVDLDPVTAGQQTAISGAQGEWSVDVLGAVTFTPAADFNGMAVRSYAVKDDGGEVSNSANITITVSAVNTPPVANNDAAVTSKDLPVVLTAIAANDTDVDGTIDVSTVDLDPATGGQQTTFINATGAWTVNGTGDVTYSPAGAYVGDAAASYTVNDNAGGTSNIAALMVRVNDLIAGNTAPIAVNDNGATDEETEITLTDVTSNDTDADGTVDQATVDLDPILPGRQTNIVTTQGTWTVNDDADVTFVPAINFNGITSKIYIVQDDDGSTSNSATISVTVNPVNDAPVAVDDSGAANEGTIEMLSLITSNDTDVDGTVDASTVDLDPATAGKQTTFTSPDGTWTVDASGNVNFTPVANFNGTALSSYTVQDNLGLGSNVATLTVLVNPSNDAPIANDDFGSTPEDTPVSLPNLTANDTDIDSPIAVASVDLDPGAGGLQISLTNSTGNWSVDASGVLTYEPVADFNGTAFVQYTVNDNSGATSNTATVTIVVDPVNDPPVAIDDEATTLEDVAVSLPVTANDTDVDGTPVPNSIDLDSLTPGLQNSFTNAAGEWSVDDSGALTYQPTVNFNGTAQVTYIVADDLGLTSNVATVTVLVAAVNDPPVAGNDAGTTMEDMVVSLPNVTTNDTDTDNAIDVASVDVDPLTPGRQSTLTNATGIWSVDESGVLTYKPAADFNGTGSVTYIVADNSGAYSNPATITIIVEPVNDAPVLEDLYLQTQRNKPVSGTILLVTDNDPEGTTLTINTTPVVMPGFGSITIETDGSFIFTPANNYVGNDALSIEVCDTGIPLPGACAVKQVDIEIMSSNNPPVILVNSAPEATLTATTTEDTPIVVCFRAVDPEGDPVEIGSISNTAGGGALLREGSTNFCFQFTPEPNFTGNSQWVLQACDNGTPNLCGTLTISIEVTPLNDPPVAMSDTLRTLRNVEATLNVLDNEIELEGQLMSVSPSLIRSPAHGDVTLSENGDLFYRSDIQFRGIDSLIYEVCDNATPAACSHGKVVIIVDDLTLMVYEGISPNGDGVNDFLRIDGIDYYIGNEVQIFDRYSNLVFQMSGYNNEDRVWYGQSNRGLGGADLPEETYFYTIRLGDGGPPLTGFVVLKRR
jgi:gliding motility-associated-like protein